MPSFRWSRALSSTSKSLYKHVLSPTSVTNIYVTPILHRRFETENSIDLETKINAIINLSKSLIKFLFREFLPKTC